MYTSTVIRSYISSKCFLFHLILSPITKDEKMFLKKYICIIIIILTCLFPYFFILLITRFMLTPEDLVGFFIVSFWVRLCDYYIILDYIIIGILKVVFWNLCCR